ncbi:MAG: NADH-quinone oxidoreductase subunit A [Bdellovibrionales bacterium]|nr:NADH-quinone oxidoreductase subunit A [Bdellovibrionales bacterium]
MMMTTYFPVLVLMILVGGFAVTMILLSIGLGPKVYSEVKDDPFECGTVATGDVSGRHSVKFYLVAMTFIVFDVEIVFLYPWAINVRELGWWGFWAAMPFLAILTIGLIYEWKRGVLDVV